MRRHWSKLPPIQGFTRMPDGPDGQRRASCNLEGCNWEGPTLGTAMHTYSAKAHGAWAAKRKKALREAMP